MTRKKKHPVLDPARYMMKQLSRMAFMSLTLSVVASLAASVPVGAADTWLWLSPLDLVVDADSPLSTQVGPEGRSVYILKPIGPNPAQGHVRMALPMPPNITNDLFAGVGTKLTLCYSAIRTGAKLHEISIRRIKLPQSSSHCFTSSLSQFFVGSICHTFDWSNIAPCETEGGWVLDLFVGISPPATSVEIGAIGIKLPDPATSSTGPNWEDETVGLGLRAHPNPIVSSASLEFSLAYPSQTRVAVYDALGREVRVLADRELPPGTHQLAWDGKDARGNRLASGVYFYEVRTELGETERAKAVLLR